jgi:hypothetical protein
MRFGALDRMWSLRRGHNACGSFQRLHRGERGPLRALARHGIQAAPHRFGVGPASLRTSLCRGLLRFYNDLGALPDATNVLPAHSADGRCCRTLRSSKVCRLALRASAPYEQANACLELIVRRHSVRRQHRAVDAELTRLIVVRPALLAGRSADGRR